MASQGQFSPKTAAAIVVANMIGTGVFTSLGFQLADIRSGFVIVVLWITGGIIGVCGALCYAELSARLPRSGGEYNFLREIFHPAAGFISGLVSATVGFAAPTALAAMTFGLYLSAIFPVLHPLLMATALVFALVLVHSTSHKNSAGLQDSFTQGKLLLIVIFSVSALLFAPELQPVSFLPSSGDAQLFTTGAFAVSLIYVSYAYSGWNAATYLTGEVANPNKTLPRVLGLGTLVVTCLYVLLNVVFLLVAPMEAMAGEEEVGYIAAVYAFGDIGGTIMGISLSFLLISTVSAMIVAAPRVYQVVGQDFPVLKVFAKTNQHSIPRNAILLQGALTLLFLWTASFQSILIFAGATMALNTLLAVTGLLVLRYRQGKQTGQVEPAFTVPLYPLPPLIFIGLTGATLFYLALSNPLEIGFAAGLIGVGLVLYWLAKRSSS